MSYDHFKAVRRMCHPITTFGRNPFCIFQRFCRAARKPCQHERPTRFILIRIKRQRRGSLRQNMKTCPAAFAYGSDFLCWSRHGQEAAILPSRQSCCEDSAGFDQLSCNRGRNCQRSTRPGIAGTSPASKRVSVTAGWANPGTPLHAIGHACGCTSATEAHSCVAAGHR